MKIVNKLRLIKQKLQEIFINNESWKSKLTKKYPLLETLPIIPFNKIVSKDTTLHCFSFLDGTSTIPDLILLQSLCEKFKDCTYFEIGTWRGESVKNVSEVCSKCYTLNLSKQQMLNLKMSEKYADLHGFFSNGVSNILHLKGDTLTYDFSTINQKFDVIFIDGDHRFKFVKNDTEKVFKYLMHENSIVVWHDYGFSPLKINYQVYFAILEALPMHLHQNLYQVSNTMCCIFTKQKYEVFPFDAMQEPNLQFGVQLSYTEL